MGLIEASIQFKETLEEVKYQIESLEDYIKDVDDDEQRGYLKATYDNLKEAQEAQEEHYESSIVLLQAIDKIISK